MFRHEKLEISHRSAPQSSRDETYFAQSGQRLGWTGQLYIGRSIDGGRGKGELARANPEISIRGRCYRLRDPKLPSRREQPA
jgi:hypothetical protein